MKNDDEEFLEDHMRDFNITIGTILVIMLAVVAYMFYDTSHTKAIATFTEEHVIEITKIDPPKYFRLGYYDHTLKEDVYDYSKRCSSFKEGHFVIGQKYLVQLKYKVEQYKDEPPKRILLTRGCELYDTVPFVITA